MYSLQPFLANGLASNKVTGYKIAKNWKKIFDRSLDRLLQLNSFAKLLAKNGCKGYITVDDALDRNFSNSEFAQTILKFHAERSSGVTPYCTLHLNSRIKKILNSAFSQKNDRFEPELHSITPKLFLFLP